MAKLFAQEVPEIYDGIIEIKAVAPRSRQPGEDRRRSRATARSTRSAPASACAAAASRPSSAELQGEKVDIIPGRRTRRPSWSMRWRPPRSPRSCSTTTRAASRSWCRTSSFRSPSAAAARTCVSPRSLTGWDIDILTEAEESERRQEEIRAAHRAVHGGPGRRRVVWPICWSPKASATIEELAFTPRLRSSARSRASTRILPASCSSARSCSCRSATCQRLEKARGARRHRGCDRALTGPRPASSCSSWPRAASNPRRSRRPRRR